ncbi:MAG: signal recognition particle-docking protein FtsY [Candidatus Nanopelagicaceae bacterium]|nr:signal recognition particle-docking protein FtsY [Candidatus Nanopelagicaceae bacterium]
MGFFKKFLAKVTRTSAISAADWDELYAELIASDLGATLSEAIVSTAKKSKADEPVEAIRESLTSLLSARPRSIQISDTGLTTVLVIGVNGTGKTTSVAKLAAHLSNLGNRVLLGAADTFRAAGVEQLQTWGARIGLEVVTGKSNGEPAAVAFDSASKAKADNFQYLVIDTAGRLQNKADLMAELGKIKRVVEKVTPVNEVLLVVDATTGQNGLSQAKLFSEAVEVTGIVLTKLDGSARGGIALAIEHELDLPIKWIGTGEAIGDLAPFEPEIYISGILGAE